MKRKLLLVLMLLYFLTSLLYCDFAKISTDPVPGEPWDYTNPDYAVIEAYNSLQVMDVKKNEFITSVRFRGYFVSFAQIDNLFYCNDAGGLGDIPSSLLVIDSNEGKLVDKIQFPIGVEFVSAYNNKLYVSHGVEWEDGSYDFSIYDTITKKGETQKVSGWCTSSKVAQLFDNEAYTLVMNDTHDDEGRYFHYYLHNLDTKELLDIIPSNHSDKRQSASMLYKKPFLYIAKTVELNSYSDEPLVEETYFYKYDWNTKELISTTSKQGNYYIRDTIGDYFLFMSYECDDNGMTSTLSMQEETDTGFNILYEAPTSHPYNWIRKGDVLYIFDGVGSNTYDIFDFTDINNIQHTHKIKIPNPLYD